MPDLYALIGNPLKHSFSEAFFNAKFKQEGINAIYQNFEIKNVSDIICICQTHTNLCGFNVTMPYKETIIPLLSNLDSSAQKANAVNAVKVSGSQMKGYNTDIFGFNALWDSNIKTNVSSVLILGSGGASKAVQVVLKSKNINYLIASRQPVMPNQISYPQIWDSITEFQVIINATPLGMSPFRDVIPPINTNKINKNHTVIDLIYNPSQTRLLQIAASQGAKIVNGWQMFENQAIESWNIWSKRLSD
ncbi:MAG: shikimate dehydrogenase [Bacteroidales bacterium]|jgi:shikimate dehydrogenase|nr:shikimate dehydrogenase [Bacteroidales bacterium]